MLFSCCLSFLSHGLLYSQQFPHINYIFSSYKKCHLRMAVHPPFIRSEIFIFADYKDKSLKVDLVSSNN